MTDPLPGAIVPDPRESATGVVDRLAAVNWISPQAIHNEVAPNRIFSRWSDKEWAELAALGGFEVDTVDHLRRANASLATCPAAIKFLGRPVRAGHLVRNGLRVCPSCIAEGGTHREIWNLLHAVACPTHGTLLVDACPCGRKLSPLRRGRRAFTCICGHSYGEMTATPAPTACITTSAWLAHAFDEADVAPAPAPFDALQAGDLAAVIDLIGLAASTPADMDRPYATAHSGYKNGDTSGRSDLASVTDLTDGAGRVMMDWPHAYHLLLDHVAKRTQEPSEVKRGTPVKRFATSIGRILVRPYRDLNGDLMPCLVDAMTSYCRDQAIPDPLATRLHHRSGTVRIIRAVLTATEIATRLGTAKHKVEFRRVYRQSLLDLGSRQHAGSSQVVAAFLADIEERWTDLWSTMSADETSRHLDHEVIGRSPSPWVHPDLLTPAPSATGSHTRRRNASFRRSDVEEMRDRLAMLSTMTADPASVPDMHSYSDAVKTLYGGGYNKTFFLLDLMAGRIPVCSSAARPRLTDLHFHMPSAADASWTVRFRIMAEQDRYWVKHRVIALMRSLWPSRPREGVGVKAFWTDLRVSGRVRTRTALNTTEGRSRPLYHYSVSDCLAAFAERYGPSLSPHIDGLIRSSAN